MAAAIVDKLQYWLTLLAVLFAIGAGIYYLQGLHTSATTQVGSVPVARRVEQSPSGSTTAANYPPAQELVSPSGFLNTQPFTMQSLVGKQIILVDFWTYSCINCQRTIPYLNAWYEKYHDKGLTIVGVHTPEFQFEHDQSNVQAALTKFKIKYPVVLDNDYGTWAAYGNRYWPHKYLIDINGNIVYDHVGEGGYDETEQKIQQLLAERQQKLGQADSIPTDIAHPTDAVTSQAQSPETYFGANRNELLANGQAQQPGLQHLLVPTQIAVNQLYLGGAWQFEPEYAQSTMGGETITYRYQAQDVYLVAAADHSVRVKLKRDGHSLGATAGADVNGQGEVMIHANQLYKLVHDTSPGEHTLEIMVEDPGLKVYTFTFG